MSFERYLDVAQELNIKVAVITDNDRDYETNVIRKYSKYIDKKNINVFSDDDNERYTFEVCLFKDNQDYIDNHDITSVSDKVNFMLNNKSESAYRILNALEKESNDFIIPKYIKDTIEWIKE